MEVKILDFRGVKTLETFKNISPDSTVFEIKTRFSKERRKFYPSRQSLKDSKDGRTLKDEAKLSDLKKSGNVVTLYFKDLGPQIGWRTVFLAEYAGPLLIYTLFYSHRYWFYADDGNYHYLYAQQLAFYCWSFHYGKRLFESIFIHRFSHQTMPIRNLAKNCSYYWGFAALIAYFNNHNLYTPAVYGSNQLYGGALAFAFAELGNLSIHVALMNLRPKGSTVRKIPQPTWNPFTWLFRFVSCPNYTYEVLAWLSYSVAFQSFSALLFTAAGLFQMTMWAIGKHRAYRKEFSNYPRSRKAIIPFIL